MMRFISAGLVVSATLGVSAAINIEVGRQLFVDDFLVDSTQCVVRVCNHPTKAFDASVVYRVAYHGKVTCKT